MLMDYEDELFKMIFLVMDKLDKFLSEVDNVIFIFLFNDFFWKNYNGFFLN